MWTCPATIGSSFETSSWKQTFPLVGFKSTAISPLPFGEPGPGTSFLPLSFASVTVVFCPAVDSAGTARAATASAVSATMSFDRIP